MRRRVLHDYDTKSPSGEVFRVRRNSVFSVYYPRKILKLFVRDFIEPVPVWLGYENLPPLLIFDCSTVIRPGVAQAFGCVFKRRIRRQHKRGSG